MKEQDERFDFSHAAPGPLWGARDRAAAQEGGRKGASDLSFHGDKISGSLQNKWGPM
jgi:hypothetical protein